MDFELKYLAFQEVGSITDINDWRNQYLDQLSEAQELYLELRVRAARAVVITLQNRPIGYFVLGAEAVLLEYFVVQEHLDQAETLLGIIIREFSVRKALGKSFDHLFLAVCMGFQKKVRVIGLHFREYEEKALPAVDPRLAIRPATVADKPKILAMNEEVFEQEQEVEEYIGLCQILLFELAGEVIGFGIFARIIAGRPEFDIGMLVDRKYRRQGYGEYIVGYLVNYCQRHGWRAVAGCAVENVGSRRCLEKAGLTSRYRLLEFVF
jgi:RimJ/RimL family protein N-acetyltransferase